MSCRHSWRTRDDRWYPVWHLLASTGLRRSEVCGLRAESVDLDRAVITVEWKVVAVHHVLYEGDPKSESSIRESTIDDGTVAVRITTSLHDLIIQDEGRSPKDPAQTYSAVSQTCSAVSYAARRLFSHLRSAGSMGPLMSVRSVAPSPASYAEDFAAPHRLG